MITSATTGNPALATVDLARTQRAISLQYAVEEVPDLDDLPEAIGPTPYDLAIVDPFHTYESSTRCLIMALNSLRDGGVMLVHDCLPPPEMTQPTFVAGQWCGTTFAALRDVCVSNSLRWFTLDADFGIGVVVKGNALVQPPECDGMWTLAHHDAYMQRYEDDPYCFMRTIDAGQAGAAIDLAIAGQKTQHLQKPFPGWPAARERLTTTSDRTPAELDELVATLRAELAQTRRPRWQARALVSSVPRAARARIASRLDRAGRPR